MLGVARAVVGGIFASLLIKPELCDLLFDIDDDGFYDLGMTVKAKEKDVFSAAH